MKIAILTDHYASRVAPDNRAFIHARAKPYTMLGHRVQVISALEAGLPEVETFEGISIYRPADLDTARSFIESFSPDVLAIHFPYRNTFATRLAASLGDNYPIVAWIHGYETMYTAFFGYHYGINRLLSVPNDWLKVGYLRTFLARCTAVVYVSNWIRNIAERSIGYTHPQSHVIANPVDTQSFSLRVNQPRPVEKLCGIALRSLGPKYGLDIAIRAYGGVEVTKLTIIGTGPLETKLRSLIASSNSNTQLLAQGFPHAQVPEVLHHYDYFVAPSRNETQGLAMCEAMSCGLPVVATRVGGIPEFVRDGIDGYLVPPENPTALRAAVLRLVQDLTRCREMGKNARQHILEICDSRKTIAQELSVLQEACENP